MFQRLVAVLGLLAAIRGLCGAAEYYVSPVGNDLNPGTLVAPWKSIQKAANTLQPGDTVYVRRGVYREAVTVNVSGSVEAGCVVFTNYPGETPVVDGSRLVPPPEDTALFLLRNCAYVVVQGFELRNYSTNSSALVPAGFLVTGESHDIQLLNNRVRGIRTTHAKGNAFGIAVFGTSASQAASNIVIDGNRVHSLKTGNSESVVLNGNVTNFRVSNNRIYSNNNIGIDFIGFEGTCPDSSLDQARDGVCRGNVVYQISSRPNPSYGGEYSAGGIYCDGATRVLVERNVVYLCDIGIELASEHFGKTTSQITVRDNVIWGCRIAGISIGGYDQNRGGTEDCVISNNTLVFNDTRRQGNGEILLQAHLSGNWFIQNLLCAGPQTLFVGNAFGSDSGAAFDYNLYFAVAGPVDSLWRWKSGEIAGWSAWQTVTGQDAHSLFANPLFVDAARRNYAVQASSPAVDAGDPGFVAGSEELDANGGTRILGGAVDIGAFERLP